MNFGGGYGPSRGYGGPDINRLTTAPVLPDGWSKVGKGLWRHENGEESRVNPSALKAARKKLAEQAKAKASPAARSTRASPAAKPPPSNSRKAQHVPVQQHDDDDDYSDEYSDEDEVEEDEDGSGGRDSYAL